MYISVVIPSKGRPDILEGTLASLARQTRLPDELLVVVTSPADVDASTLARRECRVLFSAPGITKQRNAALAALSPDSEVIVFLDDDVELAGDYLRRIEGFLVCHPDVVGLSAVPVLDRAEDGLLPREKARAILEGETPTPPIRPTFGLYGCNMVVRTSAAKATGFDERLALYAYLEDKDFGARLAQHGRTVWYSGAKLIHLSTPTGRVSEARLGFAQVMNPAYLYLKKRTIPLPEFLRLLVFSLVANLLSLLGLDRLVRATHRSADRRRRLIGNVAALRLLLRGQVDPEAVRDVSG